MISFKFFIFQSNKIKEHRGSQIDALQLYGYKLRTMKIFIPFLKNLNREMTELNSSAFYEDRDIAIDYIWTKFKYYCYNNYLSMFIKMQKA